jgi:hypothetical protein
MLNTLRITVAQRRWGGLRTRGVVHDETHGRALEIPGFSATACQLTGVLPEPRDAPTRRPAWRERQNQAPAEERWGCR